MKYHSTRNHAVQASASQAILNGIAPDGGLYVPQSIPPLSIPLTELAQLPYQELAYRVMAPFFSDFSEHDLRDCIAQAYNTQLFADEAIAPLRRVGDHYFLELFHGQTLAFKDLALSLLPHLMRVAAANQGLQRNILILTATSGDTGKAALAGFADVPGVSIVVFYPKDGVSAFQRHQMVTQEGDNTAVVAVTGNFDEAQTKVKELFADSALQQELAAAGYQFSSANSINIGRLIPQIVYYVSAYAQLLQQQVLQPGEPMSVSVPTGNFGNILAAYYAKQMGLPIDLLVCASNRNNVLSDFFASGTYDKNRPFYVTNTPSMDILLSSNLERLIYHLSGNDAQRTAQLMRELRDTGQYQLTDAERAALTLFGSGYATEEQVLATIAEQFAAHQYVIDPHTAVAVAVGQSYRKATPMVYVATASPYKFAHSVLTAIDDQPVPADAWVALDRLAHCAHESIPLPAVDLRAAATRHHTVVDVVGMRELVRSYKHHQ